MTRANAFWWGFVMSTFTVAPADTSVTVTFTDVDAVPVTSLT